MRGKMVGISRVLLVPAVLAIFLSGCGSKTVMDAYVLKDSYLAGDAAKGVRPVRNLVVWPLTNTASGTKAKGVEFKMTDILIDKFYLEGFFDAVVIITPDRATDLLSRAGEELGLKRKPKDVDSGIVASKVGQLAGGDAIFMGNLSDYDEDKVDKVTETIVGGTFWVVDAREKAYATLDSFTPPKLLWRTTIKQVSTETVVTNRSGMDNTARKMVDQVVGRLVDDLGGGQKSERSGQEKKIADLKSKASDLAAKEEYDKAVAVWNDILKIDPANNEAKPRIEELNNRKKASEDKKKSDALKKEIDALKVEAAQLEKDGKIDAAIEKWTAVLGKDKENKEAQGKIEKLKARAAEDKERAKQQDVSKLLYQAQKSFEEKKFSEAADNAKKALELDSKNEKAKSILADANAKVEELKASEKKTPEAKPAEKAKEQKKEEPAPAPAKKEEVKKEAPAPAPPAKKEESVKESPAPPAKEPAVSSGKKEGPKSAEVEDIRKKAMAAFDKEDYKSSREEWKKILAIDPNDAQAKEMLDTTEMLMKALQ
jgi:tetratricopeptide (TPR) repeat protein